METKPKKTTLRGVNLKWEPKADSTLYRLCFDPLSLLEDDRIIDMSRMRAGERSSRPVQSSRGFNITLGRRVNITRA